MYMMGGEFDDQYNHQQDNFVQAFDFVTKSISIIKHPNGTDLRYFKSLILRTYLILSKI